MEDLIGAWVLGGAALGAALVGAVMSAMDVNGVAYKRGAIAVTKGEYVCKQVPQFVGEPQWQCRSVYGE